MRRPAFISLLGILIMTLVSCGPPTPQGPPKGVPATSDNQTVSEALLTDAGIYAQHEGVSLDEAVKRFELMDEVGPLGAALEQNESATLAGHWIAHQPDFKVVVVFTRDGEETMKKYVAEDSPLWEVLDIRTIEGKLTEAQLQAEQQQLIELLNRLGLPCSSDTDIKKGVVNVYVGDKKLFDETLASAGATLPPHVVPIVFYEPIYGAPPFPLNPDPSIHFPQLKMRGFADMALLSVGDLTVRDGYLYVGNALVIWQPDYFLSSEDGKAVVLDREGKVVAREGEEVVMGGGGVSPDQINKMLKEPLPAGLAGPFHLLASTGTRLSLNFNSQLFGLEVVTAGERKFHLLTVKAMLDEEATDKITVEGAYSAGTAAVQLKTPMFVGSAVGSEYTGTYTVFWPEGYSAQVADGAFEIVDEEGKVVVRGGDKVQIQGRIIHGSTSGIPWQLHDELPGGCFQPYLIVDKASR